MIYRLWNEAEHRYATDKELKTLRVNVNGCVEQLTDFIYTEDKVCLDVIWRLAPEWDAEWGIHINSPFYEKDVVEMELFDVVAHVGVCILDRPNKHSDMWGFYIQDDNGYMPLLYSSPSRMTKAIGNAHEEQK